MNTLQKRMNMALLNANPRIQEKDLAEKIGKSPKWFAGMKRESFKAKPDVMESIAKILDVPAEWLIHGTGPAPTWAPKPPPEQETLQKSMDLLLKMFAEQQAELKALRQEIQDLKPKRPPETATVKRRDEPVLDRPQSIPANVV